MTRPTLDQRIEAARKEADRDRKSLWVCGGLGCPVEVGLNDRWLHAFATALEASAERGDAETRIAELERERDEARHSSTQYAVLAGQRAAKVDDLTAQLAALTASVSAAKREGAREFADKFCESGMPKGTLVMPMADAIYACLDKHFPAPEVERCAECQCSFGHSNFCSRLHPAPVPPSAPERVTVRERPFVMVQDIEFRFEPSKRGGVWTGKRDGASSGTLLSLLAHFEITPTDDELRSLLALAGGAK